MKAVLKKLASRNYRAYFNKWKFNAFADGVLLQNEEGDGPTNVECWHLRQKNLNLIKMLQEDGITNKQIQAIHKASEDKYKTAVEKSLCRILCR